MPRGPRPAKVRLWTDRLHRFDESGQTVAQFCKLESISTASFYQWRRKLAGQTQGPTPREASSNTSRARSAPKRTPRSDQAAARFRQIMVTPDPQPTTCLTVRLPDGVQLDIRSHLPVLEALLENLLEHASASSEDAVC